MSEFVRVAKVSEIPEGAGKIVQCGENEIALCRAEGKFYAVGNMCPHMGGPLAEGSFEGKEVTCPWHGWNFNLETGISPVNPNATVPTFEVKVVGEEVWVSSQPRIPGE